jgi:hypothetical protein
VAQRLLMRCVIMRTVLALTLFTAACANTALDRSDGYDSVRERLQEAPARLHIGGEASTGMVTARRWTASGWHEGDTPLDVESGELKASVDTSGALKLESFEVGIAPVDIPEDVFKKPAQLADLKVKLTEATSGAATWSTANEATARLTMKLDLGWSIAINGGKTPLGEQHLPPVDVDFTLDGDGEYVGARISLAASGELWDWAGLLELTHLELQLGAETTD